MSAGPLNVPLQSDRAGDSARSSKAKSVTLTIVLQASHRLGSIALLATLGTWAMMYLIKDFHLALAIAAGCANVGMCCGLAARMMTSPATPARREANGVTIFNLVLFVLALHLMLLARLDVIRSAAGEFFTPSPYQAPHG